MTRSLLNKIFAIGFLFSAMFNIFYRGKTLRGIGHFAIFLIVLFIIVSSDERLTGLRRTVVLLAMGFAFVMALISYGYTMFASPFPT
jgi:TM2 domain-containing membrane protein YozV